MAKNDILGVKTTSQKTYLSGKIDDWDVELNFESENEQMPKEINVTATKNGLAGPRFTLTHFTNNNSDSFNFNNGATTDLVLVGAVVKEVQKVKESFTK